MRYVLIMAAVWAGVVALPGSAGAQDASKGKDTLTERFNLHFQATYVYQYKPSFNAKYSGPNSLSDTAEKQNSVTATMYLGLRLWKGGEVYLNPELAGGSGLSGAYGLAASTNGETFRVGDPAPTLYIARGFLRQTFALGAGRNALESQPNQLAGHDPENYLRFYLGKLSLGDIFDNNAYANSPRTQFMNWCLMNNGAWDYAANLRGYTYAFASILQLGAISYKAALATLPVVANGGDLNTDLGQEYSLNGEITHGHSINAQPGNVRLLVYDNNGHMGNYKQALLNPVNGVPDVTNTRQYGRHRTGGGLSADQQINDRTGVFARAAWNDGQNETWAFTETDRSVSAGVAINGAGWKRKNDNLSLAVAINGLSESHRNYLAAGGAGFQLGDGHLSYAPESAAEVYYSCKPVAYGIWLSADYQFVLHPGFNQDRGPVHVFAFRVHVEL